MSKNGVRAAIYTRISHDTEGLALGVDRQLQDCNALAERLGLDIVASFEDNDISASGKKIRPGWEAMLSMIEDDKVDAVLAYSSSRMYRRVADLGRLVDLAKAHGIDIHTVASGNINLDTADGRMMAGILAQIDQGELERVSERQLRKRKELRASGRWGGGHRPFGYSITDADSGGKILEPDEAEAAVIQDGASKLLNGVSLNSVTREWNERGTLTTEGNPWTVSHVRALFMRDLAGILSSVDQDKLTAMFDGRRTGKGKGRTYLLTGLMVCGLCGGRMNGRPQDGVPRYICLNTGKLHLSVKAEPVDELVATLASGMTLSKAKGLVDPHSPLVKERQELEGQMAELGASDIPLAALRARTLKLEARIVEIDGKLKSMPSDEASTAAELARIMLQYGDEAMEVWNLKTDPSFRARLEVLVDHITIKPAGKGWDRSGGFEHDRVQIGWRDGVVPIKRARKRSAPRTRASTKTA